LPQANDEPLNHIAYLYPAIIAGLYEKKGKDILVIMPYSEKLRHFGNWAADQI